MRDAAAASPRRGLLTFAGEFAVALLGHPARAREMRIVQVSAGCGVEIWVEAEQNLNHLAPIGAVARGIEQAQIKDHMLSVIFSECLARWRLVQKLRHHVSPEPAYALLHILLTKMHLVIDS